MNMLLKYFQRKGIIYIFLYNIKLLHLEFDIFYLGNSDQCTTDYRDNQQYKSNPHNFVNNPGNKC